MSVQPLGRFVEFRYGGEMDLPSMIQTVSSAHAYCQTNGLRGAILDLTAATGTLTGLERFELARVLAPGWDRSIALATVITQMQTIPGKVGQLVAQNRGLRVRVFKEEQAARAWLETTAVDALQDP